MLPKEGDKKFSIPSKFDAIYKDFKSITETASYRIFEARTRNSHEKHSIRILDSTKDLVVKNFDSAARLFIQELSYLQIRCPGSVLIKTLEISKTRKQIACAIRYSSLVGLQLDEMQQFIDLNNPKVIEKLLSDVISDLEFLWRDLKIKNIASILVPENIYYFKEKGTFFLGNWDKIAEENTARSQDHTSTVTATVESELRSQDIAAEIKALAFALLKMKKVKVAELESLLNFEEVDISIYEIAVKSIVAESFNDSQKFQNLVERMLSLDPRNLPDLEQLKIKEDKFHVSYEKAKNEASTKRKVVGIQVVLEETKINPPSKSIIVDSPMTGTPLTLLAWCSDRTNKISVIDLETKQDYATFDGVQCIHNDYIGWTHVKEIQNTKLLVSLYNNYKSANIEIFDISKKGIANKIYSLGEVSGSKIVVGYGDATYNSRRNIIGAISSREKITYHLFTINTGASNTKEIVKLGRKSKWHWQYSTKKYNFITGFDFNPAGDSIATIDAYGVCLISDVNTNNYVFHLQFGSKEDPFGCCRWSTNTGESSLFVNYGRNELNILDVEKKALIFSNPVELDNCSTYWIDVCQSNANLLASGGSDKAIKIFDKRESEIVKTFDGIHSGRTSIPFPLLSTAEIFLGLSASSDKVWTEKKTKRKSRIQNIKKKLINQKESK